MKHTFCTSLILCCLVSANSEAAERVIADDGREVQLNDDGSWEYLSSDRFATSATGKRIRLMDNGTWELTGELAVPAATLVAEDIKMVVGEQPMEAKLARLSIESKRSKKSESHKSSSKKTQTVFALNFTLGKQAEEVQALSFSEDDFEVVDSGGREYDIVSVTPARLSLSPGEETTIVIRVDGSPHWFTIKAMSIVIDKMALGSEQDLELSKPMSEAKKTTVDGFKY